MSKLQRYYFGPAKRSDAEEVFRLVHENPHPFLRRVRWDQVLEWFEQDRCVCWIARDLSETRIVATCNMNIPLSTPDRSPDPAEFGGLFTDEHHRLRGVAAVLGVLALTSYFWDTDPDSLNPIPLLGHVEVHNNPGPRPVLVRLGFEQIEPPVRVPGNTPGFEHMPKDNEGFVNGDEFRFQPKRRVQLFRQMAGYLSTRELPRTHDRIELDVPLGMTAEALEELATQLERAL